MNGTASTDGAAAANPLGSAATSETSRATGRHRILVVDDDAAIAEMVGIVLADQGWDSVVADTGTEALLAFDRDRPDLVLLDVMLPGLDGVEVCRRLRERSDLPIVMLSARSEIDDVVRGLEAGADDYVVKPFRPQELVARVQARLRRVPAEDDAERQEPIRLRDLVIDPVSHEVRRDDGSVALTPLEFRLLATLAAEPRRVFTREELLEVVWGYHYKADTRLVNVHVQRLRAKIEHDPDRPQTVVTVRGVGYRIGHDADQHHESAQHHESTQRNDLDRR